ncbi:quinol monooxygenase YgiN [Mycolicibacterium sp. BK634]|uniref:putative quinol monooxygenase n=1 Tax=Mycobacteriaceae TaxID=1762 RepID=UPI0010614DC8|nr:MULTISPECIES: antibiotic biosynthesis monooxygenase family protein [Mycobacteriaceae]MBB3753162.1 quinol monooxygenase YgiN [Mycolicibacterium sp. BK634]TDO09074.1 quinol monooxygenase YgiN [Mycobacterium sp. BK086]
MDAAEPVVVIAHWQTTQDALGTVVEHTAALRAASRAEPGCLSYETWQNAEEPTSLIIVERYRDVDAQQAHLNSPHYQEHVVGVIRPLLVGRQVEVVRVREV